MKNNKFNSNNIRKIIREEINAKYGNSLKEHEIIILEAGVIQGIKNVLGGIFGVGDEGAAYVGKKIGNIGTGIEKAVASVKSAYATGKLGPASKAFNDLFSKTKEAGEELVAMHQAAGKPVPDNLKQFNTAAAALAAKEIKAEEAKNKTPATSTPATGTPATGTPATGTPATGTPATGTPATGTPATGTPATGTPATGTPATGTPATGTPATGTPATGAVKAKTGMGESKPVAINKGPTSLQSNLFKLAGSDAEKKKQITGVLKALGGDLKTGKIPITEAADLVNLKNTVTALQSITDPSLFKSVKGEIVKILANIGTKVNIDQVKSARQAKTPAKPAAAPAAEATAGTTPAATE